MSARITRTLRVGLPPLAALLLAAAINAGLAGCARHADQGPASGDGAGAAGRLLAPRPDGMLLEHGDMAAMHRSPYPLAVGNRWDYTVHTRLALVTPAGPRAPVSRRAVSTD